MILKLTLRCKHRTLASQNRSPAPSTPSPRSIVCPSDIHDSNNYRSHV